jgi:hypothetical protein
VDGLMDEQEILKELEKIDRTAWSVGFTPYLAKKRDNLYKKLWRIKKC